MTYVSMVSDSEIFIDHPFVLKDLWGWGCIESNGTGGRTNGTVAFTGS